MPQLDPSIFPTQLLWLLLTFIPLYLIVWRLALPRITEVRNARRDRIDDDLDKAERLRAEAQSVLQAYEKVLADAVSQAQVLHRDAAQELAEERARQEAALARRLSDQTRAAEERIAHEKNLAVDQMREAMQDVVRSASERLIGVAVSSQEAETAIRASLSGDRK